jgi:hypothetical protein
MKMESTISYSFKMIRVIRLFCQRPEVIGEADLMLSQILRKDCSKTIRCIRIFMVHKRSVMHHFSPQVSAKRSGACRFLFIRAQPNYLPRRPISDGVDPISVFSRRSKPCAPLVNCFVLHSPR